MSRVIICGLTLTMVITLAATAEAGWIVAWGSNEFGALDVPDGDDFVAVAAGRAHSLALREDGSLVAWGGNNASGELDVPPGNDFVAIAASTASSHALTTDGWIVTWGGARAYAPTGNDFVAVAAGTSVLHGDNGIALREDGSLLAFGFNCRDDPQLCYTPDGNDFVAVDRKGLTVALRADGSLAGPPAIELPPGHDYVAVAAGVLFGLALREDGSLAAWRYGQGVTDLPTSRDFAAIDAGFDFGVAIREDGSLAAWGDNTYGQLDVPAGNRFVAISAGWNHALAIEVPEPSVLAGLLGAMGVSLSCGARRGMGKWILGASIGGD